MTINNSELHFNFVSFQRMLNITVRYLEVDGGLNEGEINTLKYLFSQLNEKQQNFILDKYGGKLIFFYDEPEEYKPII